MGLLKKLVAFLSSYGLAVFLVGNLFLLTLFGTLYQVEGGLYDAQKRYFESWVVTQRSPIPLALPGGLTTMGLLAINLLLGGFVRIKKSKRTAGVLVVHVGIAMLLAAGFVKLAHSDDGHLTLIEGQESDEFASYYLWEVAVWDASQREKVTEHVIDHADIVDLVGGRRRSFTTPDLPFEIELSGFQRNVRPMPKGPNWQAVSPTVDGYAFLEMEPELEAERNLSGVVARFRDTATGNLSEALLWGVERYPATFDSGGRTWAITLRHKRFQMPFAIRLVDFRKEDHPGMSMARSFESDVVKVEDGAEQNVRIQMNEPLRHEGLVLFQSGFDRQGGADVSVFSVVRNPSDYWPLYGCIVISVGLLMTFVPKLRRYVKRQAHERALTQGT